VGKQRPGFGALQGVSNPGREQNPSEQYQTEPAGRCSNATAVCGVDGDDGIWLKERGGCVSGVEPGDRYPLQQIEDGAHQRPAVADQSSRGLNHAVAIVGPPEAHVAPRGSSAEPRFCPLRVATLGHEKAKLPPGAGPECQGDNSKG